MTFLNRTETVTDVAAIVYDDGTGETAVLLRNVGEQTCYVGPSGVTTATGLPVATDELVILNGLGTTDVLYAVCDAGQTTTVTMLSRDA